MVVLFRLNMMVREYLGQQMVCCFRSLLLMLVSAEKTDKNTVILFKDEERTLHVNTKTFRLLGLVT